MLAVRTSNADLRERHSLMFADVTVEVVIANDGEVSVDFHGDEPHISFDGENWKDVVAFVKAAVEMSES